MTPVTDKSGNIVAYLYNNMVVDISMKKVMGVVLGNCIFGDAPTPLGKFFNNVFRNRNGKMVGMAQQVVSLGAAIDNVSLMESAWKILIKVKDHVCGWVPERSEWSDTSLPEFLKAS